MVMVSGAGAIDFVLYLQLEGPDPKVNSIGKFVISGFVMIKMRKKYFSKACNGFMFSQEVPLAAKSQLDQRDIFYIWTL